MNAWLHTWTQMFLWREKKSGLCFSEKMATLCLFHTMLNEDYENLCRITLNFVWPQFLFGSVILIFVLNTLLGVRKLTQLTGFTASSGFHLSHPKTLSTPHHTSPVSTSSTRLLSGGRNHPVTTHRTEHPPLYSVTHVTRPARSAPPRLSPAARPAGHRKMAAASRSPAPSSPHVRRLPQPAPPPGGGRMRRGAGGALTLPAAAGWNRRPCPPPPSSRRHLAAARGTARGALRRVAAPVRTGVGEGRGAVAWLFQPDSGRWGA